MNDNNDSGKKPTLLVPNKQVVDLQGRPVNNQGSTQSVQNVAQIPQQKAQERTFKFELNTGEVIQRTGFLIATSSFIGLGVGEGEISLIVPTANLHFVNEVLQEPTALEQFPDPQGVA